MDQAQFDETIQKASDSAAFLRDELREAIGFLGCKPTIRVVLTDLLTQTKHIVDRLQHVVEMEEIVTITCELCGKTIRNVDAAIEAGWLASYCDGDDEMGPVCPECTVSRLDKDGNLIREGNNQ